MNKERYNQIIDEVYKNYLIEDCKIMPNFSKEKMYELGYRLTKNEFIDKIKTETKFSKKWGLMIKETYKLVPYTEVSSDLTFTRPVRKYKLIVVYKDEIIEVYE